MPNQKYALVGENRAVELIVRALDHRPVVIVRHADNTLTATFEHVAADLVERRIADAHPAIEIVAPDDRDREIGIEEGAETVIVRFGFKRYPN